MKTELEPDPAVAGVERELRRDQTVPRTRRSIPRLDQRSVLFAVLAALFAGCWLAAVGAFTGSGARATFALLPLGIVAGVLACRRPLAMIGPVPSSASETSRSGLAFGLVAASISVPFSAWVLGPSRLLSDPANTLPLLLWPVLICPLSAIPIARLEELGMHRLVWMLALGRLLTLSLDSTRYLSEGLSLVGLAGVGALALTAVVSGSRVPTLSPGMAIAASALGTAVSRGTQAASEAPQLPFVVAGLIPLGVMMVANLTALRRRWRTENWLITLAGMGFGASLALNLAVP